MRSSQSPRIHSGVRVLRGGRAAPLPGWRAAGENFFNRLWYYGGLTGYGACTVVEAENPRCGVVFKLHVLLHHRQRYDFHAVTTNKGSAQAGRSLHGQHVKTVGYAPVRSGARSEVLSQIIPTAELLTAVLVACAEGCSVSLSLTPIMVSCVPLETRH